MPKVVSVNEDGIETEQGTLKADKYVFVAIPRTQCKLQGWFMGFQGAFEALGLDKEITIQPMRVLMFLLSRMDFENFIAVEQKEISKMLGMHKTDVSLAMKKLVDKGILEKGPKLGRTSSYRMNLNYAWKGKAKNREAARKELYKNAKLHLVKGKAES